MKSFKHSDLEQSSSYWTAVKRSLNYQALDHGSVREHPPVLGRSAQRRRSTTTSGHATQAYDQQSPV
ncbi:hypothetical protein M419DRAFT_9479 [Trichoderma reesei RUT C-30]|uniref:Uncharacterized protein n=1 Tax=Hypocrea jecorina (strain ATCC 56765 / BCRC 32924 / NRRL 11460 / Rut C-30) TaxID=1344414 RepID=A0A024S6U9_HYPJR|nr:hypothetical protein M419DRAFT_9479 [Trichoderma reesei RUT C-30]